MLIEKLFGVQVSVELLRVSTAHGAVTLKLPEVIPFIAISYLRPADGHADSDKTQSAKKELLS